MIMSQGEKGFIAFLFLSVMGSVMAGHRVHKRPVLVERKKQQKVEQEVFKWRIEQYGELRFILAVVQCNCCGCMPRKKIVLSSTKREVPSIYILGYFLIQLFFIPAACVKRSLSLIHI